MEVQTCGKPLDALIERVLCTNILSSDYFKELFSLKTYTEVVDEIYNQVDHVEPWMTGNCRGPSTAFCLLYKLFTMKFTVKQMQGLLDHPDSPFIRALGFLYLRYVGDPKTLWGWFEQYVRDPEEFAPGSNGKNTTMGVFVRDLLLNQYYFDTLFPRIPVPILRQITAHLEQMKLPTQPSGVTGTNSRHGSDDTARRPPSVKAALSVSFGQRAPHRAFTRDSSPVRRTAPVWEAARNSADNERDGRDKDRDRDYDRDKSRISRDKQRLDIPPRDRGRDREQERERDRTRDRERSRDYDREGSRGSRGRDDKDRDNSSRDSRYRDADRSRDERGRGSGRERGSDREDDYSRDRRRDRSADRDRGKEKERERRYDDSDRKQRSRSPRRPSRSVDRADRDRSRSPGKSAPASSNLKKLLDVYGDASHTKTQPISGIWALCCGSAEACGSCKQRISIVDEALTGLVFWVSSVTRIGGVQGTSAVLTKRLSAHGHMGYVVNKSLRCWLFCSQIFSYLMMVVVNSFSSSYSNRYTVESDLVPVYSHQSIIKYWNNNILPQCLCPILCSPHYVTYLV